MFNRLLAALAMLISVLIPGNHSDARPGTYTGTDKCIAYRLILVDGSLFFGGATVMFPDRVQWQYVGTDGSAYLRLPHQDTIFVISLQVSDIPSTGVCQIPL